MKDRQHPRVAVDRHVPCEAVGWLAPVYVYDLSAGGCMFEVDETSMQVGQEVTVTLATAPQAAVVVWAFGECVGVRFRTELHAAIVEHYGFKPSAIGFDALSPRDKFGRLLPPLSKHCA
jgi:hypothetical protein